MRQALFVRFTLALMLALAAADATPIAPHEHAARLRERCGAEAADTVAFLENAHIVHTTTVRGAVVDCVPFLDQPALLFAPKAVRSHAQAFLERFATRRATAAASVCGATELVPVVRTRPELCRVVKGPAPRPGPEIPCCYSYVVSPADHVPGANFSSLIVAVGDDAAPLASCAANGECHSLNQLWWLTTDDLAPDTFSLETGWIASNYFTPNVTTSIFAFSTNDGYKGDSDDQYNTAGGFVAMPGADVVLGLPLASVRLQLMYSRDPATSSFVLSSRGFTVAPSGDLVAGSWSTVGHYPYSRYPNDGESAFAWNQAGCEVYFNGGVATASGTVFGWGTNQGIEPIDNQFTVTPADSGLARSYGEATWDPANEYASASTVTFSGSIRPGSSLAGSSRRK